MDFCNVRKKKISQEIYTESYLYSYYKQKVNIIFYTRNNTNKIKLPSMLI